MATFGNGYIATRIYSDSVFVSGVYNGRRREPSHTTRVPSTVAIRMSLENDSDVTTNNFYSLDVERGLFTHRVEGSGFSAEELIYAHRKLPNLLVVEVRVRNEKDQALKIDMTCLKHRAKRAKIWTSPKFLKANFLPTFQMFKPNMALLTQTRKRIGKESVLLWYGAKYPNHWLFSQEPIKLSIM